MLKLTAPLRVCQYFSLLGVYVFYLACVLILIVFATPWDVGLGYIEDFLIYMPRWLFLVLLIPIVIFNRRALVRHMKFIVPLLCFFIYFYLDVNVPNSLDNLSQNTNKLSVMTANLGGVKNNSKLAKKIKAEQPDLITFQETDRYKVSKLVPSEWNVHCIDHMCLVSRFDMHYIKKLSREEFNLWGSYAVLYSVDIYGEAVNVINVHMETPRKGFEALLASKNSLNFQGMAINIEQRYSEARNIIELTLKNQPFILSGDFNMPSNSRIYQEYYSNFINTFSEKGLGLGYTKFTRYHGVRIDHILHNEYFGVSHSRVIGDIGGDHRPLISELYFSNIYQTALK